MIQVDSAQVGITAVLLFGSRARGDNSRGSDTDLLLISPLGRPRHKSSGHLSMFFYPWANLLADAGQGDLFVCHLTMEAQPIFDPTRCLDQLRAEFKLRESYAREIRQASDVGWFLDRHADELDADIAARKMLWCVRTILIARSAERGQPVFAPTRLAATTSSKAAAWLLVRRHRWKVDSVSRHRFRRFLSEEAARPTLTGRPDLGDFEKLFQDTENRIGLQLLRSSWSGDVGYS